MPKIPLAVVSTSSDDSDSSTSCLAADLRSGHWSVVNMVSIESFPFSEVSHQPYGMESTFLDSVSPSSATLRARNSTSGAQDVGPTAPRGTPQSPRPLFLQGPPPHQHAHARGINNTSSHTAAAAALASKSKGGVGGPAVLPGMLASTLRTSRHTADLPMNTAILGAPPTPSRERRAMPVSRRRRSLQVGAPRWQDNDGSTELLVRREVSKNKAVNPMMAKDCAEPSSDSSSSSVVLAPPPLCAKSPSKRDGDQNKTEVLRDGMPPDLTATVAPTPKTFNVEADSAAGASTSDVSLISTEVENKKRLPYTTTLQLSLPMRRVSSPGGHAAPPLAASAQRLSPSNAAAKRGTNRSESLRPSPMPSEVLQHTAATSSSTATAKAADLFPLEAAGRATLSTLPRIALINKKQVDEFSTAHIVPSPIVPVQASSNSGGDAVANTGADASGAAGSSREFPTSRTKPKHSMDHTVRSAVKATGGVSGAANLLSVSSSSPSAATSTTITTTTTTTGTARSPSLDGVASADHPQWAKQEQRRRTGRQRFFSIQSKDTDGSETASSSIDTVVVRPNVRHATLKPLVMSPDESKPLRIPGLDDTSGSDHVSDSLTTLSLRRLASSTADASLHAERRAKSVTPSVDATPTPSSDFSSTPNKLGSIPTKSPTRTDSSPSLRPQTREFTKPADSATGTASCVSPGSRVAAEKLVTFVRAVSDPEVLHVIHDYLVEHQRTMPRYRLAAEACEELLERKEELLRTREPEPVKEGGDQHNATFHHATEAETFTIDAMRPGETSEATRRAAEVRRLLEEIAAEQKERAEDPDADEFDDFNFFDTPYPPQSHFNFSLPTVSGVVSRVFAEGMLFKIKSPKGEYYFYNDTLQDVMMVRVQCVLRGNETINERAMLVPVEGSKETEITIAVLPEETNFFMSGVSHLPHFMAKRVAVPPDYVSPSVTQSLRKINAEINIVRKALGKWSRASDQSAFLRCCVRNHFKFTDLTFRPCVESLFRRDCDAVSVPPLTWRRPEEYVYLPEVSQTRLFRGEISCFLVKQGELNNHTVVAAMAAVAQFPDHVRWMFRHPVSAHVGKMERAVGCYRVALLHNGWWKTYVIDDYVPASQKGPLFASCAEDPRRLWVPLLEKAYAKSLGSYAATCVVDAMEAMGDFTGFPVRYLDSLWAAVKSESAGAANRTLFSYLNRVVRTGCTVLLFTPAASDEQSKNTVKFSRKRSSRLLPVKGVIPQFLPGHIYFLKDVAFYKELDLRMAQLKNPWTWEAKNNMHREKKWEYTTWYDRPDVSASVVGSVSGSFGFPGSGSSFRPQAAAAAARMGRTEEERLQNDRKGTMWVEWGELLAAFAGGGVCYTLWNYHRYRAKNSFVNGRPRFVLEMKARRKLEMFVTLSLEAVSETLDNYGNTVASHPTSLYGTALSVVQRLSKQSARVVSESCEDIECIAARRTYVVAKDVSMKVTIDPHVAAGTVLVVPLLDPQAVEDMAAAASAKASGGNSSGGATGSPAQNEVHFVLSLVSSAVAGDGEDLSISFVSMRRSCGVFTDAKAPFDLESTSRVTSSYQICTEKGVQTLEGNRICDAESAKQSS